MLTFTTKHAFFDRQRVIRALDKGRRRALSKAGAFVRQRAKTSIRKRRSISEPGSPPSSHTGLLRKFIWFAYDPTSASVAVGPVGLRRSQAPAALEHGGLSVVEGSRRGRRVRRVVRVRPRPYMHPALAAEAPNFPDSWANCIREG